MQRKDELKMKYKMIRNIIKSRPVGYKLLIVDGAIKLAPNTILVHVYTKAKEPAVRNKYYAKLSDNVWMFGRGQ